MPAGAGGPSLRLRGAPTPPAPRALGSVPAAKPRSSLGAPWGPGQAHPPAPALARARSGHRPRCAPRRPCCCWTNGFVGFPPRRGGCAGFSSGCGTCSPPSTAGSLRWTGLPSFFRFLLTGIVDSRSRGLGQRYPAARPEAIGSRGRLPGRRGEPRGGRERGAGEAEGALERRARGGDEAARGGGAPAARRRRSRRQRPRGRRGDPRPRSRRGRGARGGRRGPRAPARTTTPRSRSPPAQRTRWRRARASRPGRSRSTTRTSRSSSSSRRSREPGVAVGRGAHDEAARLEGGAEEAQHGRVVVEEEGLRGPVRARRRHAPETAPERRYSAPDSLSRGGEITRAGAGFGAVNGRHGVVSGPRCVRWITRRGALGLLRRTVTSATSAERTGAAVMPTLASSVLRRAPRRAGAPPPLVSSASCGCSSS